MQYRQNARPTFSIHSLVLEREEQAVIAKELEKEAEKIAGEGALPFPHSLVGELTQQPPQTNLYRSLPFLPPCKVGLQRTL